MRIGDYLSTVPSFLLYFGTAIVLFALFVAAYMRATPHNEVALIRAGNPAAALGLGGAALGFVIPLASVVVNSQSVVDMLVWGLIALIVQLATFAAARVLLPGLPAKITQGDIAHGTTAAAFSVCIGLLNAACMTY